MVLFAISCLIQSVEHGLCKPFNARYRMLRTNDCLMYREDEFRSLITWSLHAARARGMVHLQGKAATQSTPSKTLSTVSTVLSIFTEPCQLGPCEQRCFIATSELYECTGKCLQYLNGAHKTKETICARATQTVVSTSTHH